MMSHHRWSLALVVATALSLAGDSITAQNAPAVATTTGRTGRGGYPLPTLPAVFETFQHNVRVSVVARGLDRPWSLLILPDVSTMVVEYGAIFAAT